MNPSTCSLRSFAWTLEFTNTSVKILEILETWESRESMPLKNTKYIMCILTLTDSLNKLKHLLLFEKLYKIWAQWIVSFTAYIPPYSFYILLIVIFLWLICKNSSLVCIVVMYYCYYDKYITQLYLHIMCFCTSTCFSYLCSLFIECMGATNKNKSLYRPVYFISLCSLNNICRITE